MSDCDTIQTLIGDLNPGAGFDPPAEFSLGDSSHRIQLVFGTDVSVRVRLLRLEHQEDALVPHVYENLPGDGHDARLWHMGITLNDFTSVVGADSAGEFCCYHVDQRADEAGYIFVWHSMGVSPEHELLVALKVTLRPDENVSRWVARVRWHDSSVTAGHPRGPMIDSLTFPICSFRPLVWSDPSPPTDAAELLRILIPDNTAYLNSLRMGSNRSFQTHLDIYGNPDHGPDLTCKHPQAGDGHYGQSLQFAVLYDGSPQHSGRTLYCGTEDTMGQYKVFRYQARPVSASSARGARSVADARFEWSHTFIPGYENDAGEPVDERNAFTSYPVVLGALLAKSPAFWHDAAAFYRDTFVAKHEKDDPLLVHIATPPLEENDDFGLFKGPSLLGLFSFPARPEGYPGGDVYQHYVDLMTTWTAVFEQDGHLAVQAKYMYLQGYLASGQETSNPDYPVDAYVEPSLSTLLLDAYEQHNIRAIAYTRPTGINTWQKWWDSKNEPLGIWWVHAVLLQARLGALVALSKGGGAYFDRMDLLLDFKSHAELLELDRFPLLMHRSLTTDVRFTGAYLDTLSGGGPLLTYPRAAATTPLAAWLGDASWPPKFEPPLEPPVVSTAIRQPPVDHGGWQFTHGKIMLARSARQILRNNSFVTQPDPDVVITSELAEEYLTGHLDLVGHAKGWPPQFLLLFERAGNPGIGTGAPPGLAAVATDRSPPLWDIVYHEYAQTGDMIVPLTNVLLDPQYEAYEEAGIEPPAQEIQDMICYFYSLYFTAGTKQVIFPYFLDASVTSPENQLGSSLVVPGARGTGFQYNDYDTGVSQRVFELLKRLLYACSGSESAGEFMRYGRMERPVAVDYESDRVDRSENPFRTVYLVSETDPQPWRIWPTSFIIAKRVPASAELLDTAAAEFEVPRVLTSMWSRQGRSARELALVLVNWSDSDAHWEGTFDPLLDEWIEQGETYSATSFTLDSNYEAQIVSSDEFDSSTPLEIRAGTSIPGTNEFVLGPLPGRGVWWIRFAGSGSPRSLSIPQVPVG